MTSRRSSSTADLAPSDPIWAEVVLIAEHRQIGEKAAAERRRELLRQDWGPAAIRQMIYDQWCKAPDPITAEWIWETFDRFNDANPVVLDRRRDRR